MRVLLPLGLLGALVSNATAQSARDRAGLARALAAYDSVFARQDPAAIASWFVADGAMGSVGHPPILGPDAIAAQLRRFADFHLLADSLVADSTRLLGDSARMAGHYWQRVRLPAGDTVEAHGTFLMTWVRVPDQGWRLRRLITDP